MTENELAEKNAQFAKGVMELAFRMGYVTREDELVKCKDCARGATCFMYRESGNDYGFCAWSDGEKNEIN